MIQKSWLTRLPPAGPTDHRLVCVPYAGGSVAAFRGWNEHLPSSDVAVVQMPGRGARAMETPIASLEDAAQLAVAAVMEQPRRPTALFGHSLGAIIAFEMAQRLAARGWPLLALFVSGRGAPTMPDRHGPIAHLPFREFVAKVQSRYGAIPPAIRREPELLELLVPGLRADIGMVERYRCRAAAPLPCPIVGFCGATDPHATESDVRPWAAQTSSRFDLHVLPGGHFFLQEARAQLTAILRRELAASCAPVA